MTAATNNPATPIPRAPTQAAWEVMTETEREAVLETLTATMPELDLSAPEGDIHNDAKDEARDTLRTWFRRSGRSVYVSAELGVYYPDADRFAPDLLAVMDVDPHPRSRWVVSAEGKGLDWVLEVLVDGDRRKDLQYNVVRYAELGIPEYFVLDARRHALRGYRLPSPGVRRYEPIIPQHGAFPSAVLGLDLSLQNQRVRFRRGNAELLVSREIIDRLEALTEQQIAASEELAQRLEEETRRREEAEQQREEAEQQREEAERRVAQLTAELETLRQK